MVYSQALGSSSILAITVYLALAQPRIGKFQVNHASAALIGATLIIALGIVPADAALNTLKKLAAPLLTIVSLMLITATAEQVGLLNTLARFIAQSARGDGKRLFAYLFWVGALTGTVLTNDATILLFTPMIVALINQVQESHWPITAKIPFYFAVLYVGNLVGALVISNPINIVASEFFEINFFNYLCWMALPAFFSMLVSFWGLRWFFDAVIPKTYHIPPQCDHEESLFLQPLQRKVLLIIGFMLLILITTPINGLPIGWVVCATALTLLLILKQSGYSIKIPLAKIDWSVILFACGVFVISMGLRNAGLSAMLSATVTFLAESNLALQLLVMSLLSALCSAVINNHSTVSLMVWVVQDLGTSEWHTHLLVFAALIGGDLGPKMLPIGSLAALMWFGILRRHAVVIPYHLYIAIGIPTTLLAVVSSTVVLILEVWLYQWWTT